MKIPFINRESNAELEAEARQISYSREQTGLQAGTQESMIDVQERENRTDLLKWQQDLTDEGIFLVHRLRREVLLDNEWKKMEQFVGYDKDGKKVYSEVPAYLNELGIQMIVDQAGPLMSRNIINSNLSEERILRILEETCNAIAANLADYYDVYEAEFMNFDVIMRLIKNTIVAAPFRALHGWNKKIDSTIIKRVEAHHEGIQNQPRKKVLGLF